MTGGGPEEACVSKESEEVIQIIGEDNPSITGHQYGIDSSEDPHEFDRCAAALEVTCTDDEFAEIFAASVEQSERESKTFTTLQPVLDESYTSTNTATSETSVVTALGKQKVLIETPTIVQRGSKSQGAARVTKEEMVIRVLRAEEAKHEIECKKIALEIELKAKKAQAEIQALSSFSNAMDAFAKYFGKN